MNQRPKLATPGTVTILPDGKVIVQDFDVNNASCREVVQIAIVWAQEHLARSLHESLSGDSPRLSAIN